MYNLKLDVTQASFMVELSFFDWDSRHMPIKLGDLVIRL
jgi:hypothetical protein